MKQPKIEPGYWRCRNGSRARVLCTDAPGDYPVVGYVIEVDEECPANPFCWTVNGLHFASCNESSADLIEPWRDEPEPEKPIEVTLSQVREAAQLLARRVDAGLDADIDDCLARAGISVSRPPAKQPVRVSGWAVVNPDSGDVVAVPRNRRTKQCMDDYYPGCIQVYLTGVEGGAE